MSEQVKLHTKQKSLQNPKLSNKNIQINMSTLSSAQKQMCLKLLASSDINFEEDRNENCFEAELRIDPSKLNEQFAAGQRDVQEEPKVSPIKKRMSEIKEQKKMYVNAKQNIAVSGNKKKQLNNKQQSQKNNQTFTKAQVVKQSIVNHAIYTNSRKALSKTVKINTLTQIEKLHPFVQLYIYPKKMSFQSLIELIQEIYELYWCVEIQGKPLNKVKKQTITKNNCEKDNNRVKSRSVINENRSVTSKSNKSNFIRQNITNNNDFTHTTKTVNQQNQINLQNIQAKSSFPKWVYDNFIMNNKEKMRVQQLLVNLIQSLNHFSFKHMGVQMFVNFLSGAYSLDVLNYFLVIRALLEQLSGQKIIEKVSSYGSRAGVTYKMKLNPYMKQIQQQRVYDFLQVCFQGSKEQHSINQIFQQMTQRMFFDQKKRKNYIHYFDMVDILLKEFLKVQTMNNTTNLQFSVTQTNDKFEDFGELLSYENGGYGDEHEIELTFQFKQAQVKMEQMNRSQMELNHYLPNININDNTQQEITIQDDRLLSQCLQKLPQTQEQYFYGLIIRQIYIKYQSLCRSFFTLSSSSDSIQQQQKNLHSKLILDTLIQAVMKHNKKAWIDLLKNKSNIKQQRQTQQLHFIQQLQKQYQQIKKSNFISNQFIKKMLTASYLRQAILIESGINQKAL